MDSSSSRGNSNRQRRNRSGGGGGNRNRNRNQGQRQGGGRPRRKPEDDIMRERFPRPEPKPTLWQRILGFFGIGGDAASKPAETKGSERGRPSADKKPKSSPKSEKEGGEKKPKKKRAKRTMERVDPTSGRLYVGNLDYGVTDEDLAKFFSSAGTVEKAEIVIHQRSGKSKGFGFVEMASVEEAKKACDSLHDQEIQGRQILVSGAKSDGQRDGDDDGGKASGKESGDDGGGRRERKPRGEKREREKSGDRRNRRGGRDFGDEEPEPPRKPKAEAVKVTGTKLSIGNLSGEVTPSDVKEGVEDIAPLVGLGEVANGAIVAEFASVEDAQRALDVLSGKVFMGQPLKVTNAQADDAVGAVPETPQPAPVPDAKPETTPEEASAETPSEPASAEREESTPEPAPEPQAEVEPVEEVKSEAAAQPETTPEAPAAETPAEEAPAEEEEAKDEEKPADPQP